MSLLIPVLILAAGAVLAGIAALVRFRYIPLIQASSALLASIALIGVDRASLPRAVALLAWRPISLFGVPVTVRMEPYGWALCMAVLISLLAVSLRRLAQLQQGQSDETFIYSTLQMLMGAALLLAITAANVLTLLLAWGGLDVVYGIAVLVREGRAAARRVEIVMGLNEMASLLVWISFIFLEQDSMSLYWHLMTLSAPTQILLGVAAFLRVGFYPLYAWSQPGRGAWVSGEPTPALSRPTLLNLLPMVAGLALWIRLAALHQIPSGGFWVWGGLVGALLMGLLACSQPDARQGLPYTAIGLAGLLLVAGCDTNLPALHLTLGAITWLLGMYLLTESHLYKVSGQAGGPSSDTEDEAATTSDETSSSTHAQPDKSPVKRYLPLAAQIAWGLPAGLAWLAMLGLPGTPGWLYRSALHAALSDAWTQSLTLVLAETLLIGAALRYALAAHSQPINLTWPQPLTASSLAQTFARRLALPVVGLILATLPLLLFGLWPRLLFAPAQLTASDTFSSANGATMNLTAWITWIIPWAGALALAMISLRLPAAWQARLKLSHWGKAINALLDLGWLYTLFQNSLRRSARWIGGLGTLIEGKGALVWTLVVIALILLYLR